MRISFLMLVLLVSRPAFAGPSVFPQLVCRGTVGVVTVESVGDDGQRAVLRLAEQDTGVRRPCGGATNAFGSAGYNPEGCYVSPARITVDKGVRVAKGARYLAALEPPGGAQCATTAVATHLIPLAWIDALAGALL